MSHTAERVLLYRLAVRDEPSLRHGDDKIWDPEGDTEDSYIYVPLDLATPAGPAVAAARSGSLAEAWLWTPENEEAYQLMMNELHAESESSSPNAETVSVQSYAMDAHDYTDSWHHWHDPQPMVTAMSQDHAAGASQTNEVNGDELNCSALQTTMRKQWLGWQTALQTPKVWQHRLDMMEAQKLSASASAGMKLDERQRPVQREPSVGLEENPVP